jgi:hypothetical protein
LDFERDRRKKLGEGPWYSINSDVYHDNPHCNTGTSIEPKNILRGTGDKRLCVSYHLPARLLWEEGQIRKAKAPGDNRRPSRRRPTMGEAAVAPETQMAPRTWAPLVPERMLKRSP